MSKRLTTIVYSRQLRSLTQNAVLALLADKADDDGSGIWASKLTMADELCTSKQTVIAAVRSLVADGLLREVGRRKALTGFTIEYAIEVAALKALPLVPAHERKRSRSLTGQAASPVKEDNPTGQGALPHRSKSLTPPVKQLDPNRPRTVLEPSKNHSEAKASGAVAPKRASKRSAGSPATIVLDQLEREIEADPCGCADLGYFTILGDHRNRNQSNRAICDRIDSLSERLTQLCSSQRGWPRFARHADA